jgi:hypothetical protein
MDFFVLPPKKGFFLFFLVNIFTHFRGYLLNKRTRVKYHKVDF